MATIEIGAADLPDRWNITHLAGERFEMRVPVLGATNAAVDPDVIESARIHVRPSVNHEQILTVFSTDEDPPNIAVENDDGAAILLVTATADETSEWQTIWPTGQDSSTVWWDVEVTDTDGVTHQLTRPGTFTLVYQVTR